MREFFTQNGTLCWIKKLVLYFLTAKRLYILSASERSNCSQKVSRKKDTILRKQYYFIFYFTVFSFSFFQLLTYYWRRIVRLTSICYIYWESCCQIDYISMHLCIKGVSVTFHKFILNSYLMCLLNARSHSSTVGIQHDFLLFHQERY